MCRLLVLACVLVGSVCGGCGGKSSSSADAQAQRDGAPDGAADAGTAVDGQATDGSGPDAQIVDGSVPDGAAPTEIGVLTINLQNAWASSDHVNERTQIVIDFINTNLPDVVALQEVVETSSIPNRAEVIAAATGYEWRWHVTHSPVVFDEGVGLLSRWSIVWSDHADLPHLDLGGICTRATIGAHVDAPLGQLAIFSAHLTVDPDETVKADQAAAAYAFVEANTGPGPTLFAGDLNAEPTTLAMEFLRGDATHMGSTGDFTDAWLAANPTDPGFTIPSDGPDRRIDYIYFEPDTTVVPIVDSCEVVFDVPVAGVYASDHLGVYCRFSLGP